MAHGYQTDQYEGMIAETVTMRGHNGETIGAYVARPLGSGPFPGMVVIHHAPGWDEWYRDCTRCFAHRVHQGSLGADPRALRQRGQVADAGSGQRARSGAEEARQAVRVPSLRRRRPRLFLLRSRGVPSGTGHGWLEEALRVHRKDAAVVGHEESSYVHDDRASSTDHGPRQERA